MHSVTHYACGLPSGRSVIPADESIRTCEDSVMLASGLTAAPKLARPVADEASSAPERRAARTAPRILGVGGSGRPGSQSERALRVAVAAAGAAGACTQTITARDLSFPMYSPGGSAREAPVLAFLKAIARADGLIIASPGYHGNLSGLLKNALDYLEDLRDAARPYLDGVPVGCIACAAGWQASVMTLTALRTVVHALRGWPTPLGVALNTSTEPTSDQLRQLEAVGEQVAAFTQMRRQVKEPT